MSFAAEILDIEDIVNLRDISNMYSYIISKCDLSTEDHKAVIKTDNNLKKLLTELAGLYSQSM